MVIGTQKGRDTKENILRNFGSAHPEGYRKALRLMRLADKFGLPIITLIDTAGAYPGVAPRNATSPRPSPSICAK
jgi:acetyl-CoA carboxylase carboxyl transferase subunit alpha